MKSIHSRDNPFIKLLIALAHSSRERKKLKQSVLDGIHLVEAYLHSKGAPRAIAVAASASMTEVEKLLTGMPRVDTYVVADVLMAEASMLESPATVIALIDTPRAEPIDFKTDIALVLEAVQDPGNVGSMLRSAAAAGVREVILSKGSAFAWSPKVLRAAQGAHFSLNINEGVDAIAFVAAFAGRSLAMVPEGQRGQTESIYTSDLTGPIAILVGNEGQGLSADLIAAATPVTIPMPGRVESLNAAACAAIVLFETIRQRAAGGRTEKP